MFDNAFVFSAWAHLLYHYLTFVLFIQMFDEKLFQYLPMTEAQCLQSTRALNAVESSFPGKIPQTMLSFVRPVTRF